MTNQFYQNYNPLRQVNNYYELDAKDKVNNDNDNNDNNDNDNNDNNNNQYFFQFDI